jgi:hypothetical protein
MVVVIVLDNDEVFLRDNQVFTVNLAEDVRLEDIFGRAGCIEAGFEEHETIHQGSDHIDVVGNQEDGQAQFFMEMLD